MELFKLLGTIAIDNSDAKKALQETTDAGSKVGNALKKVGSAAVAFGKVVAVGMSAAATGVTTLVTKSIQSYADYEQLVGGVETLFKDSAKTVQEYAKNAYKTAGLSANEYMETVTSFSASLLQSLDGDTSAAAEKANMAITDMSDNANKMGTSMEAIQTAYNGFAKQNYTMLDNLKLGYGGTKEEMARLLKDAQAISGIEYDISSYADVVDAIHVIQTEMGITGTTAKEASSTISGSITSMKSSWANLLTAISSDDLPFEDYVNSFVESVSTVADNLMPRIEIALNGVVQLIDKLAPIIIEKIPELFSTLIPAIVNGAVSMMNALVNVFPGIVDTLVSVLPQLIQGVQTIIEGLLGAIPKIVDSLVSALPMLLPQIIDALFGIFTAISGMIPQIIKPLVDNLPSILQNIVTSLLQNVPVLIDGFMQMFNGVVQALPQIMSMLVEIAPQIISDIVNALMENLPALIEGVVQLVLGLVNAYSQYVTMLTEIIPLIISGIVQALPESLPALIAGIIQLVMGVVNALPEIINAFTAYIPRIISLIVDAFVTNLPMLVQGVIQLVMGLVQALPQIIQTLLDALPIIIAAINEGLSALIPVIIQSIATLFIEGIPLLLEAGGQLLMGLLQGMIELIGNIPEILQTIWDGIVNGIKSLFGIHSPSTVMADIGKNIMEGLINGIKNLIGKISELWNAVKNATVTVFNAVKNAVSTVWNAIKNAITTVVNAIKNVITTVWNGIKSVTTSVWNGIKSAVSNVVNGVKNTISNVFNSIKSTATSIWNGVKNAITKPIESARDKIKGIVDKIKGFFTGMKISIPKIKMPHFGISPKGWKIGDLLEGSIPKLSIDWYAKAMRNPMVMTQPTVFGYNSATGKLMGGGEAGSEVVAGTNTLMGMIRGAVADQNNGIVHYLKKLIGILAEYFPQVLEAMDRDIVLDSGALVGAMVVPMDQALGKLSNRKDRGR